MQKAQQPSFVSVRVQKELDNGNGLYYNISVRHEGGVMTIDLRKYYLGASETLEWEMDLSEMELVIL